MCHIGAMCATSFIIMSGRDYDEDEPIAHCVHSVVQGAYLHYKMCSRKLGNVLLLETEHCICSVSMYVCSHTALAFGDGSKIIGRNCGSSIAFALFSSSQDDPARRVVYTLKIYGN